MSYKLNPFTGNFDLLGAGGSGSPDNFSYSTIAAGVTVTIPLYQQMIVVGFIDIIGTLNIDGELVILS